MTVKGSCHCGATQFTVTKRPATVTRCTCSFCSKRGALWAYQDSEDDFVLTTARGRGPASATWNDCTQYRGAAVNSPVAPPNCSSRLGTEPGIGLADADRLDQFLAVQKHFDLRSFDLRSFGGAAMRSAPA